MLRPRIRFLTGQFDPRTKDLPYFMESFCTAPHGTVTGYRFHEGRYIPEFRQGHPPHAFIEWSGGARGLTRLFVRTAINTACAFGLVKAQQAEAIKNGASSLFQRS